MSRRIKVTDEEIIVAAKTEQSAAAAARKLGIKYDTYKIHATRLGVFKTNQFCVGIVKKERLDKISLEDILSNKEQYKNSNRLKKRLIEENVKEACCEICGIEEWLGKPAPLELDHINGDRFDNSLENLQILCPNCHAQTETYRGKNKKISQRGKRKTDEEFLTAYEETTNIRQALIALGLAPKGANYDRMKRLLEGV